MSSTAAQPHLALATEQFRSVTMAAASPLHNPYAVLLCRNTVEQKSALLCKKAYTLKGLSGEM